MFVVSYMWDILYIRLIWSVVLTNNKEKENNVIKLLQISVIMIKITIGLINVLYLRQESLGERPYNNTANHLRFLKTISHIITATYLLDAQTNTKE